ncbi:hypothetical protein [Synechococcus sp. H65.1]|uniref:hypothetical protein n=1 Tax=unclassified Synechococcus TaxID=2626047 RepID=UPI0039C25FCB
MAVRAQGEILEIGLFLGVWRGQKVKTQANWLQWWTADGSLLLVRGLGGDVGAHGW